MQWQPVLVALAFLALLPAALAAPELVPIPVSLQPPLANLSGDLLLILNERVSTGAKVAAAADSGLYTSLAIPNLDSQVLQPFPFSFRLSATGVNDWTTYPSQPFSYRIEASGLCGNATLTQQQNVANGCSCGPPYPCQWVVRKGSDDSATVSADQGLRWFRNGSLELIIPSNATGVAWTNARDPSLDPLVTVTLRQACGGQSYFAPVWDDGWVRRGVSSAEIQNIGGQKVLVMEPFDQNSMATDRTLYNPVTLGGLYVQESGDPAPRYLQPGVDATYDGPAGRVTLSSYSSTASYSVTYLPPNGPSVCAATWVTGRSSFSWSKNVSFPADTNPDQRVTASAPYVKTFTQAALDALLKNTTCPAAACNITLQPVAAAKTSDPEGAVAFAFWPANRTVAASTTRTDLLTPLTAVFPLGAFGLATGGTGTHTLRAKLTDGAVLAQATASYSVCSDQDADRFCPEPEEADPLVAWDCDDTSATRNPNATELCNGLDDTCDGEIDETFRTAENNIGAACGVSGSACAGVIVCTADGTGAACNAAYRPGELEPVCGSGKDNDCDGIIDDEQIVELPDGRQVPLCSIQCQDGDTKQCGSSFGICRNSPGTRTCVDGQWSDCIGGVQPRGELCNKLDDNCDGIVDNIGATIGDFAPAGGTCGCANGALPATEVCNGIDDDCNGAVDDGGVLCCSSGQTRSCGEGACSGVQQCVSGAWESSCQSAQVAGPEVCDSLDNDCNGLVDDNCASSGQPQPPPTNSITLPLLGELNPLLLVLFGGMAFLVAALLLRWEKKRGRSRRAARETREPEEAEETEEA